MILQNSEGSFSRASLLTDDKTNLIDYYFKERISENTEKERRGLGADIIKSLFVKQDEESEKEVLDKNINLDDKKY